MEDKLKEVKAYIRSILISFSFKNLTTTELSKEFYEVVGEGIPFRTLGFSNLHDFLKSIPDVLTFLDRNTLRVVSSEKSNHIKNMVMSQKVPRKKPARRSGRTSRCSSSYKYNQHQNQQKTSYNQQQYHNINVRQYYQGPVVYQPQPVPSMQFGHQYMNVQQCHQPAPPPKFIYNPTQFRWYAQNNSTNNQQPRQNVLMPNEKKDQGKVQKKVEFGEISIIVEKADRNSTSGSRDLIDLDNSPLAADDSDQKYFNDIDLNASILDIEVSEQEARSLPRPLLDAFGDLKIDENQTQESDDPLKALDNDPYFSWAMLESPIIDSPEVRIIDDDLLLAKDQILRIFVTQTFSPSRFWFNNGDLCHEMDQLMAQIDEFYSELSPNEMRIPEDKMVPGLTCAAIYEGIYHRGEIIAMPHKGKVRVYFVDFGTNELVAIDKIKYLVKDFANLPRQALRGCCDSIEPYDSDHWGWDAINQFHIYVRNKAVWAQVIEYSPKTKTYRLALIDKNEFNEIHINKMMIIKNYAQLVESKLYIHDHCLESAGPFCYHHPPFDTLEQTDYPGFSERTAFYLENNVEYYLLEELYNLFTINPNMARNKKYSVLMTKQNIPIIRRMRRMLGMDAIIESSDN